jgi:hypothetical protein
VKGKMNVSMDRITILVMMIIETNLGEANIGFKKSSLGQSQHGCLVDNYTFIFKPDFFIPFSSYLE